MTIGLIIPPEVVAQLSPGARAELFALLPFAAAPQSPPSPREPEQEAGGDELIRFSVPQARRFLAGLHPRSYATAVWIAGLPEPTWTYSELLAAMGVDGATIRGMTSALTRRARTVTGNAGNQRMHFKLYSGGTSRPENWRGRIHPDTQAALRVALAEAQGC